MTGEAEVAFNREMKRRRRQCWTWMWFALLGFVGGVFAAELGWVAVGAAAVFIIALFATEARRL